MNKKRKGAYLAFLTAKNVGLLVSIKPGQNLFRKAIALRDNHPEKNCYIFVQDTLDFNQIENFPFVDVWINTACNRIMDDAEKFPKPLIDIADIEKAEQSALLSVKV